MHHPSPDSKIVTQMPPICWPSECHYKNQTTPREKQGLKRLWTGCTGGESSETPPLKTPNFNQMLFFYDPHLWHLTIFQLIRFTSFDTIFLLLGCSQAARQRVLVSRSLVRIQPPQPFFLMRHFRCGSAIIIAIPYARNTTWEKMGMVVLFIWKRFEYAI